VRCYSISNITHSVRRNKAGRPTLLLLEDMENDLRELEVKRWKPKANNRGECQSTVKEAGD
jgi:hypothetical protein